MQPQQTEWLDKAQAAEVLGMSTRSVLTMAAAGKIQSKRERDQRTNQMAVKLHAGDVERIRYEREHPETPAVKAPQGEKSQALQASQTPRELPTDVRDFAYLLGTVLKARTEAPVVKPWLTLETAAEYSGLSRGLLLRLIRQGVLPAFQDKPRKVEGEKRAKAGSSWRVCRRDLDALRPTPTGMNHGV